MLLPRIPAPPSSMMVILILMMIMLESCLCVFYQPPTLVNKWLPSELAQMPIFTQQDCENICLRDNRCDAYAVSLFERKCRIYDSKTAGLPVLNNGYNIYIKQKTKAEGYFVFNTMYIKLGQTRLNAYDAAKACAEEKGSLLAVKNKDIEKIMLAIMQELFVWTALIGVSDEEVEGNWKYSDTSPASYQNWEWNGMWPRADINCALAVNTQDGIVWKQVNCWHKNFYFCQIPMF